jgi:long-chain acyl-CoA synthetase
MDIEHPSRYAAFAPDRPAVIMAGSEETLTYGELDARSNQAAHLFRSLGLQTGDNVAVVMENRLEYFEVVWGALRSGLLVTPINWHLSAAETQYIVADCEASVVVASASCAGSLSGDGYTGLVVGGTAANFASYEDAIAAQPATPIDGESEGAWMFYSSGTTGRPKGIKPATVGGPLGEPTTFTALVKGLYGGSDTTRYLSPAPLYHAAPSGWSTAVHRLGGTVVITERFDPVEFLEAIQQHEITLAQVVPTHLVRLLKLPEADRTQFDLSSLSVLVHAAAPCPVDVKRAVMDWLGPVVYEYYSGSEGVGFCAIGPEEWLAHPGSVGRSLLGTVHIMDDNGAELPVGTEGQVWFETPARFEYHGDPAKTAEAFDRHGWSTLGEVGSVDSDGYLYLTDRVSNMIISGGVNIYPREIEDALILHPGVVDVAVIGVADAEMGEAVRAIVQPTVPPADPAAFEAELIEHCRERIARFKCPRSVVFVDELPRLATGKIARRLLPEALKI